jgi:hypothetical protein
MVGAAYEPLIDTAITQLIEEQFADFTAWEE